MMADLSTILGQIAPQIGQLLGITAPAIAGPPSSGQQATTPGAPGGPAPSPTAGQIFEAPATQGLLNAYLGYLAAPRGENRWQRLGQAGLEGLHGFSQAEQFQAGAPQRAAALAQTQATTKEKLASAGLKTAQATALGGKPEQILAENKRLHDMAFMRANDPTLSPTQQAASKAYAEYVAGDSLSKHDIKEYESVLKNPLELDRLKAQIAETQAHTGEAGARTTEALASAGRSGAEAMEARARAGLVPTEKAHIEAETSKLKEPPVKPVEFISADGKHRLWMRPGDPIPDGYYAASEKTPKAASATKPMLFVSPDGKSRQWIKPGDPVPANWRASTERAPATPKPEKTLSPESVAHTRAITEKAMMDEYVKLHPPPLGGATFGIGMDEWRRGFERFQAERSASGADAGPPPLPPGATSYAKGPSGELGYHDTSGAFHPFP